MTSLAAVPRQPALDVRGRGPVAAVPANVNKQYWSALFDQLIAQQSLPRVSFQLDRCQQLESTASRRPTTTAAQVRVFQRPIAAE